MKSIATLVLLAGLALLLSACGLVNALIPDQAIDNAFGLDNQELTLTVIDSSALRSAASTTFSGDVTATFDDPDLSDVPAGIRPDAIEEVVALGATVSASSVMAVPSDFPDTMTITGASLSATVDDPSNDPTLTKTIASDALALSLAKADCNVTVGTTCTFSVTATDAQLLLLSIEGSEFDTVWTLLSNGSSPNTLDGTFELTVDQALPSDSQVTIVLDTNAGTLKF